MRKIEDILAENLINELKGKESVVDVYVQGYTHTLFGKPEMVNEYVILRLEEKINNFNCYVQLRGGDFVTIERMAMGLNNESINQYITELELFEIEDIKDIDSDNYDSYLMLFDMKFMLPKDNWMRAIYIAHLKTLVEVNS